MKLLNFKIEIIWERMCLENLCCLPHVHFSSSLIFLCLLFGPCVKFWTREDPDAFIAIYHTEHWIKLLFSGFNFKAKVPCNFHCRL